MKTQTTQRFNQLRSAYRGASVLGYNLSNKLLNTRRAYSSTTDSERQVITVQRLDHTLLQYTPVQLDGIKSYEEDADRPGLVAGKTELLFGFKHGDENGAYSSYYTYQTFDFKPETVEATLKKWFAWQVNDADKARKLDSAIDYLILAQDYVWRKKNEVGACNIVAGYAEAAPIPPVRCRDTIYTVFLLPREGLKSFLTENLR